MKSSALAAGSPNKGIYVTLLELAVITCLSIGSMRHLDFSSTTAVQLRTGVVAAWAMTNWVRAALPPALVGLMALAALVLLKILTFEQAIAGYGHPTIILVFSVLVIGRAIQATGIERRVSLAMLKMVRGNARLTVLAMMVTVYGLSFFLPSALGRVSVLLPIALGLCREFDDSSFEKMLLIGMSYSSLISTTNSIIGAAGIAYSVQLFKEYTGFAWSYYRWAIAYAPMNLVTLLLSWYVLSLTFRPRKRYIARGERFINAEYAKLGRIRSEEYKVALVITVMIVLWATEPLHDLPTGLAGLIICIFTVFPGLGVISWQEALRNMSWDVLLLFGSSLALARAITLSGVNRTLGGATSGFLVDSGPFLVGLITAVFIIVIRSGLNNITAVVGTCLPVVFAIAEGTKVNPVWLGMISVQAGMLGFCVPTQSVAVLATYSTGRYTAGDLIKSGLPMTIVAIGVVIVSSLMYWPYLGLGP